LTRTVFIILMVLAWLPGGAPARGQAARDLVAAIDVQRIYREAKAAKAFRKQIDQQRTAEQDRFRAREKALLAADKELRRQQSILSEEAFAQKGQELTKKATALQRDIQNHNKALKDRLDRGLNQIQGALIEVVGEIAAERNLDLVVTAGSVVLQNPELDITNEAMARLDAKLPVISLDKP
jgi:Skp family chaperone for outer membrane proteins